MGNLALYQTIGGPASPHLLKFLSGIFVAHCPLVGGHPAREIRKRFAPEAVSRLLQIRWWDWPIDQITRQVSRLTGGDLDALEAAVRDNDERLHQP
jgi:hypothetical protein